jgi:hypothetical protein
MLQVKAVTQMSGQKAAVNRISLAVDGHSLLALKGAQVQPDLLCAHEQPYDPCRALHQGPPHTTTAAPR